MRVWVQVVGGDKEQCWPLPRGFQTIIEGKVVNIYVDHEDEVECKLKGELDEFLSEPSK